MHKNATRFHEYVEKHETRKNGERRGKKDELPLSARLPESNGDFLYNGTSPHDYCRAAYFQTYFSAARLRMEEGNPERFCGKRSSRNKSSWPFIARIDRI